MSLCDRAHTNSYWRSIVTMALYRVVSEIFNVKKCSNLEIGVRGHSRSLKVLPFDRSCILLVFFSNFFPKTHRFWYIRLVSIQWPWNPDYGPFKVIENDTIRSGTHDFLLTFHSNHRHIWHRFRDKRRFPSKIANFSHPRVFWPVGIGYRRRVRKTRTMGLPDGEKSYKTGFAVQTQYWFWQTYTRTDSKDRT